MEKMKRALIEYLSAGRLSIVLEVLTTICREESVEYDGEDRDLKELWHARAEHFSDLREKIKKKEF